jgi:hypothetical protein
MWIAKACARPNDAQVITVVEDELFLGYMIIVEDVLLDNLLLEIRATLPVS